MRNAQKMRKIVRKRAKGPIHFPEEIAEDLEVSVQTVYNWLRDGKLRSFKMLGLTYVAEFQLEIFLGLGGKNQ